MALPSAEYILSMLNPYKGFSTAESAKMGIAAGQSATDARERRLGREQQKDLALADDARAGQYLDLQSKQAQHNMDQDTNDRRMKAFGAFQAAVESGDVEGAKLAANALRAFGVDVQEYGAGEQTASAAVESPPPAPPSAMVAMAQQSPTARVAQGQAQGKPMSAADQKTSSDLDALARSATVDDGSPSAGYSMDAMPAPVVPRPGPQRPGGLPAPAPAPEAPPPAPGADTGLRPGPARTQYIEGQEPAEAGEASPGQPLVRGYRISFNGQTIDVDPEQVLERQRTRVAMSLAPLLKNASTPEEQRAAQMAIESAIGAVGTMSPQEAIEFGVKVYQDPLDRGAKETRARIIGGGGAAAPKGGYGGAPGLTKEANQVQSGLFDDTNTWLNGFESKHGVQKVREAMQAGDKVAGLLSSDNPVSQRAALTATLKQWFSSVTSNTELAFVNQSAGVINQLMMELNKYGDEGRLPADFIAKLKGAVASTQSAFRKHMHDLGTKAASEYLSNGTLTSRMSPEQSQNQADMVFGRFTGVYPKTYRPGGGKAAGSGPAPAKGGAAPKPAAQAPSNDPKERARRLLGK
jgi:hypothetical protein